ncbi:MAG: hypothetical protein D5R97_05075 [Candidatus Syntrophonatronum acetioxidans]|uniref:Cobalt ECF transporter T component CbiQ n=1 Tax=Candidatus Syntrophonatronum acetioxidans TaxID=1795816 RepID=A0A424YEU8_9FIRM|nr:MAG: hypothetical protein D5R97_05075 [Candidatus Syntrophonatronum acetioxidans]
MNLSYLDYLSTHGNSVLHRSSTLSKGLMVTLLITVIIISPSLPFLILIFLTINLLFFLARLPLLKFLHLLFYPFFFALVFALGGLGGGLTPPVIVLKAVNTAALLILFLSTTPYYKIFGLLSRFLPGILVDILFISYRSFFLLSTQMNNLTTALKLRGGIRKGKILSNLKNIAWALGVNLLNSLEINNRFYQVLLLRGSTRGFKEKEGREKPFGASCDLVPLLIGTGALLLLWSWPHL